MLPIPVFRVEKNANYTTMSNYHLRDNTISFKAKGLLSLTKDQLAHYEKLFHQPEAFIRLGGHLMAVPIPDKEIRRAEKAKTQKAAKKTPGHDVR